MESREKLLNMLSLCRKAGKLSMGFDSAKEALVRKASRLCLLAADCSPKTAKEVRFFLRQGRGLLQRPARRPRGPFKENGQGVHRPQRGRRFLCRQHTKPVDLYERGGLCI